MSTSPFKSGCNQKWADLFHGGSIMFLSEPHELLPALSWKKNVNIKLF